MIVYILIGLIFLLITGMVMLIKVNSESERKRRLMSVVGGGDPKDKKKSTLEQRRAEISKKLKGSGEEEDDKKKGTVSLEDKIMQAGLKISKSRFWVLSALSCVGSIVGSYILGMSPLVMILLAVTFLLGVPRLVLNMMAKSRQKKFLVDFADALDAMTRLLRAGMPVSESIKMISREYNGPIGEEMGRVFDEQKIGIPLHEAILSSARRIPIAEMQMFATAISIQSQTGSSLSEVLENLASLIRARFRLRRKVQALSSEAKASAMIIGALPNLVATGMYFMNPDYILILFTDPTGKMLLGGAVFWMFVGVMVMRQMINFRI
jgi:tight adherence protein B